MWTEIEYCGRYECSKVVGQRNVLTLRIGLSVHMTQVHKETLTTIENALPNRSNLDVEIFGMEGIPDDVVSSHNQRVISQFAQAEAERRAATGNPGPGGAGAGAAKKPKVEDASDLKKRLAEHKAKKAAEQAAGISSGDATPIDGLHGSQSPGFAQNPGYVRTVHRKYNYSILMTCPGWIPILHPAANAVWWSCQRFNLCILSPIVWTTRYAIPAATNIPTTQS